MSQNEPPQFVPRNGLGGASFVLGVVALVFAFVPIVGEFVAAPAALLAVVFGLVGLGRVWRGVATNGGEAAAGSLLVWWPAWCCCSSSLPRWGSRRLPKSCAGCQRTCWLASTTSPTSSSRTSSRVATPTTRSSWGSMTRAM